MTQSKGEDAGRVPETLKAGVSLRLGRLVEFEAHAEATNSGLLSVAALVSGILLSTSVLVAAAIRESRRPASASMPRLQAPTTGE